MRPAMIEKQKVIQEISNQLTTAKTAIIVNFQGLDVSDLTNLRKELKAVGATCKIYKNTLFSLALKDSNIKVAEDNLSTLDEVLNGPNAFIFGFDKDYEVTKVLANYAKKNKILKLRAAILENRVLMTKELVQVASLPPKETLIAMFVYGIQHQVQYFGTLLTQLAEKKETLS